MTEKVLYWFITLLVLILAIVFVFGAITALSQDAPKYMLLYRGSLGLDFYCLDELPYAITGQMTWDAELGATELLQQGDLEAQVVQVQDCYLDNIYSSEGQYYLWGFTDEQTDEHPSHRHLSRGAWWIEFNGE